MEKKTFGTLSGKLRKTVAAAVFIGLLWSPTDLRAESREKADGSSQRQGAPLPGGRGEKAALTWGGEFRLRQETWRNFAFGGPGNRDDTYGLSRLRLHADLQATSRFRAFVEAKSALASDRDLPGGRRPLDVDTLDLQNAFVDLRAGPAGNPSDLVLRLGRQELLYGRQRMVSPLDWANSRRTFDGFRGIASRGPFRIDGFWTRPVQVRKYTFNRPQPGTSFSGVYSSADFGAERFGLDVYWLLRSRRMESASRESRHTFGTRLWRPSLPGRLDFDIELARQVGTLGDRNIDAVSVTVEGGYRFGNVRLRPRPNLVFDYAGGDRDPDDGRIGTFDPLFPLGHAFFGFIDLVGRSNVVAWKPGLALTLPPGIETTLDLHFLRRARTADALYDAGGRVVRSGGTGTSGSVGRELDLRARYAVTRKSVLTVGYSRFFSGPFVRETGPDGNVSFLYTILQLTFP